MKKIILICNLILIFTMNACSFKQEAKNGTAITTEIKNNFDISNNKIIYDKNNLLIKYLKQIDNGISIQVTNNTNDAKIIDFDICVDSYNNMVNEAEDALFGDERMVYDIAPNETKTIDFQLRYPFIDEKYKNKHPVGDWDILYSLYTKEEKIMKYNDREFKTYQYSYDESNSFYIPNKNHFIEVNIDKKIYEDDEIVIYLTDGYGFDSSAMILIENKSESALRIFSNETIQLNGEDAEYDLYEDGAYDGTWVAPNFSVFVSNKKKILHNIFVGDMGGNNTNIGLKNVKIAKYNTYEDGYRDNSSFEKEYNYGQIFYCKDEPKIRSIGNLCFWVDDNSTTSNLNFWIKSVLDNKKQHVKFGDYYTDNMNMYYSRENLEWELLKIDGEKALLMYDGFFDCPYLDENSGNICLSDAVDWLNDIFYNKTFSKTQKHLIIANDNNKMFCLTSEQLKSIYNYDDHSEKLKYYPAMWVKYK